VRREVSQTTNGINRRVLNDLGLWIARQKTDHHLGSGSWWRDGHELWLANTCCSEVDPCRDWS
jgi:hypothetical protein